MRFLLVNPYYPISETPSPPLGLGYIGGALVEAGVEVRVLDLVVNPYSRETLSSLIADFSPQFVGVTAVTMTYPYAAQVVRDVKGIDPRIRTVMGGPHVTFCVQETMRDLPELDFIVLGEGEDTTVELVKEAFQGCKWEKVEELYCRIVLGEGEDTTVELVKEAFQGCR